jgi:carotenoid cleavage dioxygenase
LQIGDLKGLFGLLMVNIQILRLKTKVLDNSYGIGTGKLGFFWLAMKFGPEMPLYISSILIKLKLIVCNPLPGNTNLIYHNGKLLALQEADKPCKLIFSL